MKVKVTKVQRYMHIYGSKLLNFHDDGSTCKPLGGSSTSTANAACSGSWCLSGNLFKKARSSCGCNAAIPSSLHEKNWRYIAFDKASERRKGSWQVISENMNESRICVEYGITMTPRYHQKHRDEGGVVEIYLSSFKLSLLYKMSCNIFSTATPVDNHAEATGFFSLSQWYC